MHALLIVLLAQVVSPPLADPQAKATAQALLKEGTAHYQGGNFAAALERFEAAYKVFPSPKLQFNIAQAHRDLGHPVEALTAFERFLAQATDAAPEIVAEARQSSIDLRSKVGTLFITTSIPMVDVNLDGKPVGVTPLAGPVWVTPGHHQVTFRRTGYLPARAEVAVSAGHSTTVHRSLLQTSTEVLPNASQPAAAPAAGLSQPDVPSAQPKPESVWSRQKWHFWAAAGGTLVFAAAAIAVGASADTRYADLEGTCGKTADGCPESEIDSVKTRATVANVLWALTGASAIGAGASFYVNSREAGVRVAWNF